MHMAFRVLPVSILMAQTLMSSLGQTSHGLWQELFLSLPWVGTEQGAQNLALASQCQQQVHSVVHL